MHTYPRLHWLTLPFGTNDHATSPEAQKNTSLHTIAASLASAKLDQTDKLQHEPEQLNGTDPLSSAFRRACSRLSDDQIKPLENTQGLQKLFEQLDGENEKSKETSPFRRGAQKLGPFLTVLGGGVGLATPLAALDPIAGNAFGIIQSVMKIAIGICGAEAKFQENDEAMLQRIPIIERCDDIWDYTRSLESPVDAILVRIYTGLFEFYFAAMDVVKGGSFFVNLQKSHFNDSLPGIVASFTANTDQLDKALYMEGIRMLLNSDSQNKEVDYYNSLQKRADKAFTWIVSTVDFREWLNESNSGRSKSSARFCILFGNMGSGKSVATSFVADFLVSHPALSGSLKPFVCVYYCKNDSETNKARNIYRSILSQILTRVVQLKARFMEWYKEAQTKNSLDELAYLVTLRTEKDNVASLADLEECMIDSAGLLELISSFVRIKDTAGSAIVRIVHQSLKELIIREAPEDWGSRDSGMSAKKKNREPMLHSNLLECCIKYLLLSDLEDKDLFPKDTLEVMEEQAYDREFLAHFDICTDETEAENQSLSPRPSTSGNVQTRDFDPEVAGFGKLFTYAACYWTKHLQHCSPSTLPSMDEVSKLSRHGSLTLRNWMEAYKRPAMTSSPQINLDVKDFDELVVAAHFGSHDLLTKFLESTSADSIGEESAAKPNLTMRDPAKQTDTALEEKWTGLLNQLTNHFISPMSTSSLSWANTLLCSASRQGCLPVITTLFASAPSNPPLTTALLAQTQTDSRYQSIGEAAFWNQPHTLHYLLEQQSHVDMTPHLQHLTQSPSGAADRNILHLAANSRNPDVFRMLCRAFPQGVNATTASGDTPLMLLVFARPASVEAVRVLLEVGAADVNFSPGGEWYSPLRTTVRAGDVAVVECLVKSGARVSEALVREGAGWRFRGKKWMGRGRGGWWRFWLGA
ncbi:hypothetical protein HRS9139_02473 [Pyrenophora teres f. teres]|uniref:Ank 2 domain containing protein n=1 Tax=Pyrenophora teres f. teres TaxID=97479 RepID=A0A6S6VTS1_9PLEO|nr:hypothetical protein HRS9139_02473 [Pyrenophora teres f. teres]CAE7015130.1 Ank 2 domain containing protein [Pyrenophora teres f. teres]